MLFTPRWHGPVDHPREHYLVKLNLLRGYVPPSSQIWEIGENLGRGNNFVKTCLHQMLSRSLNNIFVSHNSSRCSSLGKLQWDNISQLLYCLILRLRPWLLSVRSRSGALGRSTIKTHKSSCQHLFSSTQQFPQFCFFVGRAIAKGNKFHINEVWGEDSWFLLNVLNWLRSILILPSGI